MSNFSWIALFVVLGFYTASTAQQVSLPAPTSPTAIGDAPADPGPRTTLLRDPRPYSVEKVLRLVADRELRRTRATPSRDWTMVPLYLGLLAASRVLGVSAYHDEVLQHAETFDWKLGSQPAFADDQAIGQVYLALFHERHDEVRIRALRAEFDKLIRLPDTEGAPVWWWCDALFMSPPAWTDLTKVTGDPGYRAYAMREWAITNTVLWDDQEKLFFRDNTYVDKREANGSKIFWSRGNGWVVAGLVRILETLPRNDPSRPFYENKLKDMVRRIASLQSNDGLWRPGLLDPGAYPLPETSGSSFYLYAIASGVRQHLLSRSLYEPVLRKGWAGLVGQVYADGRVGGVQPVGAAPGAYPASASYSFGSGAFLLAAAEIAQLRLRQAPARSHSH